MNKKYTLSLSIIALFAITICAPLITPSQACTDYDQIENHRIDCRFDWSDYCNTPCSIRFVGTENTQSGVKFIYEVSAGSKDVTSVELFSAFKDIVVIGSSEGATVNTLSGCIKFTMDLKPCTTQRIWFELENNYDGIGCGCIRYTICDGCGSCSGSIKGPVLSTDLCLPRW
ncbi:MAG: hypothetical protein ABSA11_09795 [Candidatus Bathyarchaeia archaeon]|jgi:hypothetical protein